MGATTLFKFPVGLFMETHAAMSLPECMAEGIFAVRFVTRILECISHCSENSDVNTLTYIPTMVFMCNMTPFYITKHEIAPLTCL